MLMFAKSRRGLRFLKWVEQINKIYTLGKQTPNLDQLLQLTNSIGLFGFALLENIASIAQFGLVKLPDAKLFKACNYFWLASLLASIASLTLKYVDNSKKLENTIKKLSESEDKGFQESNKEEVCKQLHKQLDSLKQVKKKLSQDIIRNACDTTIAISGSMMLVDLTGKNLNEAVVSLSGTIAGVIFIYQLWS